MYGFYNQSFKLLYKNAKECIGYFLINIIYYILSERQNYVLIILFDDDNNLDQFI